MYDYIVIGAGSAGCVVASRLSENRGVNVLLIEAGPPDRRREIRMPAAFSTLFKSPVDWNFTTEPQEHLGERALYWPRGKVLGGSSSINAMIYLRGTRSDYDRWRDAGNAGWGYEDVAPSFEAVEAAMGIAELRETNPLSRAFVEASEKCGIPRVAELDGTPGAGFYRVTQRKGRRWSAADAFLKPALRRGNLTVWTSVRTTRLQIENGRACGVEYTQRGSAGEVRATREVIVCAGTIGSAQLLLLSGIGPRVELERLGIAVSADVPEVGANLQDHLAAPVGFACTQAVSLHSAKTLKNVFRFYTRGEGPLTSNVAEAGAFVKIGADSSDCSSDCDIQFHFAPVHYVDHGFGNPDGDGFTIGPTLLHPKSRGQIYIKSADPMDAPVIDPNYFSDAADCGALARGVELGKKIAMAPPFDTYRGMPLFQVDDACAYVRAHAETLYHPVGTCAMGTVVDADLRVKGIAGLRVADASVMPTIVGANTQAAAMMIGEKAARMIRDATSASRAG